MEKTKSKDMSCKGICIQYKALKPMKGGRYDNGQSRCDICDIWMLLDGVRCPCCNQVVRTHSRSQHSKRRLKKIKLAVLAKMKGIS